MNHTPLSYSLILIASHRRLSVLRESWFPRTQAPYRNGAVGTRLLQHALNEGSADGFIVDAYLHVQTSNDDAIAFYKRFGFVVSDEYSTPGFNPCDFPNSVDVASVDP
jgi:GNAT superfamily N-acetyltransferase